MVSTDYPSLTSSFTDPWWATWDLTGHEHTTVMWRFEAESGASCVLQWDRILPKMSTDLRARRIRATLSSHSLQAALSDVASQEFCKVCAQSEACVPNPAVWTMPFTGWSNVLLGTRLPRANILAGITGETGKGENRCVLGICKAGDQRLIVWYHNLCLIPDLQVSNILLVTVVSLKYSTWHLWFEGGRIYFCSCLQSMVSWLPGRTTRQRGRAEDSCTSHGWPEAESIKEGAGERGHVCKKPLLLASHHLPSKASQLSAPTIQSPSKIPTYEHIRLWEAIWR